MGFPRRKGRTRRPVGGIAFRSGWRLDQLGLASGDTLEFVSGLVAGLVSVLGTGANDGLDVVVEFELQAPTNSAAPRTRIATRDFNGHVLHGLVGA